MWYEARKHEKATQKLIDEQRKRAEKRREENRIDPHSLLQVNGIKSKLCLDPNVYKQAVKSLVAWQGDKNVSIDRFDVRATLTSIPHEKQPLGKTVLDVNESESVKSLLAYERFRLLIKNDINKTPENLRLQLILQSQILTGPHLKKLHYDSFGAYSDIVPKQSLNQQQHQPFKSGGRVKDTIIRKEKPATGFALYSAVPPPEHLAAKSSVERQTVDKNRIDQQRFNAASVVDLDDVGHEDDLDAINVADYNESKNIDEAVLKYGLTAKKLLLLAKRDKDEVNLTTLQRELENLDNQTKMNQSENQNDQFYGPTLPPDLQLESGSPGSPSSSSANDDSPCQQRSPSGDNIPLRDSASGDFFHFENYERLSERWPPVSPLAQQQLTPTREKGCCSEPVCRSNAESSIHSYKSSSQSPEPSSKEGQSRKREHSSPNLNKESAPPLPPRRASTPLAYKRNRRSSRSLSRERRASSNSSYHNRHRRHKESSHSSRKRRRARRSRSSSSSSSSSY